MGNLTAMENQILTSSLCSHSSRKEMVWEDGTQRKETEERREGTEMLQKEDEDTLIDNFTQRKCKASGPWRNPKKDERCENGWSSKDWKEQSTKEEEEKNLMNRTSVVVLYILYYFFKYTIIKQCSICNSNKSFQSFCKV